MTAKSVNPHTIAEEIILHGAKSITCKMMGKTAAKVVI
jgi:hypothetical protein